MRKPSPIKIQRSPLLRWAGGKSWLVRQLEHSIPKNFNNYYEPFFGGGAFYFSLKAQGKVPVNSYVSDVNKSLINFYSILNNFPNELIAELGRFENTPECYYEERNGQIASGVQGAARFYFLNRTSFNGIYRENKNGIYNVPYGFKSHTILFDKGIILKASSLITNTFFNCGDFETELHSAQKGDFAFIDPPYTVAHNNNGFVKYNQNIFSWKDQIRLRDIVLSLIDREVYFILSNAYHPSIIDLYKNIGNQKVVERYSVIGGKGALRQQTKELIISNVKI